MAKTATQKKARNQKAWWDIMREECRAHNSDCHMDDQIDLNEWPGMYVGTTVYGYFVEADNTTYTGYRLTPERD